MKGEMEPVSGSLNTRCLQRRGQEVDKETMVRQDTAPAGASPAARRRDH